MLWKVSSAHQLVLKAQEQARAVLSGQLAAPVPSHDACLAAVWTPLASWPFIIVLCTEAYLSCGCCLHHPFDGINHLFGSFLSAHTQHMKSAISWVVSSHGNGEVGKMLVDRAGGLSRCFLLPFSLWNPLSGESSCVRRRQPLALHSCEGHICMVRQLLHGTLVLKNGERFLPC